MDGIPTSTYSDNLTTVRARTEKLLRIKNGLGSKNKNNKINRDTS